ncbi:hypothetical protein [Synechococcus sp. MIT S1220]|uniref:hypothetical protein n=1 Tax=Synechococcus sp. MIT S1220 TaxID=3082549 RepID=UPI0039B11561
MLSWNQATGKSTGFITLRSTIRLLTGWSFTLVRLSSWVRIRPSLLLVQLGGTPLWGRGGRGSAVISLSASSHKIHTTNTIHPHHRGIELLTKQAVIF